MVNKNYQPVIGLEIHVELSTNSKMFCSCPAMHFAIVPNTQTCPICLGLPGALPSANEKAIMDTILIGLALNCQIAKKSKFDRKQYFYPDLPKGYQISQYDEPLATGGSLKFPISKPEGPSSAYFQFPMKKIRIRRVHIEEDTGKLIHKKVNNENVTLVDFNRSGVPLVEIVTEPDMHSGDEARQFAQSLTRLLRWLEVSDCDMEKGSMRLEANISLQSQKLNVKSQKLPNYKVEVKNINSFRFLERAINYEIKRQAKILSDGKIPRQETRGWSEAYNATISQRYKETEADYRYFPEPDIPPMEFSVGFINKIKNSLPELPEEIEDRLRNVYKLSQEHLDVLTVNKKMAYFVEKAFKQAISQKVDLREVASAIVNKKVDIERKSPEKFIEEILGKKKEVVSHKTTIEKWVQEAISQSPQAVTDYRNSKLEALAPVIGKAMQLSKGRANPVLVKKLLEEILKT